MNNVITALNKEGDVFKFIKNQFPHISDVNIDQEFLIGTR